MAQIDFDASTVAPSESLEAIPAAWYNMVIDQSELKPTKDGNGAYLELRFSVMDGQYAGRKVFDRLNIRNSNPVAQEIAFKSLSAICHAVGMLQVADSSQLHNRPLKVKVSVRAAQGDYEASNEVKGYKNINDPVGNAAPAAGAAPWSPPPQQAPQQPAQAAPQWQQPQAPQQQWQAAPAAQQPVQQPVQQPAQQWQQPAAQQPWAAAPAAAPAAPVQQPQQPQQPAVNPAASAAPPWMQQQPQQGGNPPWAGPQS